MLNENQEPNQINSQKPDPGSNSGKLDLRDKGTVAVLRQAIGELELNRDIPAAREFSVRLQNRLRSEMGIPIDLKKDYDEFLLRAQWLSFAIQDDDNVSYLLQNKLVAYLQIPGEHIDITEELRKSFMRCVGPQDVYPHYERLLKALQENTESIGPGHIVIAGKEEMPKINNWLHDYLAYCTGKVGTQRPGSFERISYIKEGTNSKSLSKADSDLLLQIFSIYDKLRFDPIAINENDQGVSQQEVLRQLQGPPQVPQPLDRSRETAWPSGPRSDAGAQAGAQALEARNIGVVPGTPLKNGNIEPPQSPVETGATRQAGSPIRPTASSPSIPTSLGTPPSSSPSLPRVGLTIAEMAKRGGGSASPTPSTSLSSPSTPYYSPPSHGGEPKRNLPIPPRPPKFSGENLGGQAPKSNAVASQQPPLETPTSRFSAPGVPFSINDALARAGENDKTKLTGNLPKKP